VSSEVSTSVLLELMAPSRGWARAAHKCSPKLQTGL